jgi:hypothetical protein
MNVRCNYCRQSFNLSRDFMIQAVAEAEEKRQKYYGVECFNCRKLVKVPLAQLKRALPPEAVEEEAEASSE